MKYHFIGIGGVSMSGLAALLFDMGNKVSGCDLKKLKANSEKLKTFVGHDPKHITKDLDGVIVTSAATHQGSPAEKELLEAKKLGIPIIKRSEMIGRLMNEKIGIAIAGMHGKTTTSTMISLILEKAGLDPTCLIGSNVKEWGTNYRLGKTHKSNLRGWRGYFVAEACEYDRAMLDFRPKIAVITNLDTEHLDTYPGGMKDIRQAFKKFIKMLPPNGLLVVWQEDKNLMPLTKAAKCKVKRVSINKPWPGLQLQIPGKHMLLDATLAARVCHELGIDHKIIKEVLNNYTGAGRRFEIKGVKNGITVIDDYGHHPTEIKATIAAASEKLLAISHLPLDKANSQKPIAKSQKLIVVFQPHQYTRTKLLFNDFVKAFKGVDKLIITDIYLIAGREPKEARADFSRDLAEAIKKQGIDVEYAPTYADIVNRLKKIAKPGDLVLTLGATDIYKVGEKLLNS
ncbi:MAG: UDP-N-acetylmuramate--L-alanine ligase [Patescibacteria group bacterium]|nr:UDP-N-acetylmuramate--L-alanine ligase [Patescibacteria group bacterium]